MIMKMEERRKEGREAARRAKREEGRGRVEEGR